MAVEELPGIRTEEVFRPRPGQEFHGHGVYLAGFHAGPDVTHGHAVPVHIGRERVARFMGHHFHVMLGSVEVGKDKRYAVIHDAGAVSAAFLSFGGKHVHQLSFQHHAEEFAGFRGQLVIELFAGCQDIIRRPLGPRIAGAEFQRVVSIAHGVFLAQALCVRPVNAFCHRYQIGPHGRPELLHVFFGIAVAAHAVVAQLGKAFIAHLPAHAVPQLRQFIVDLIQLVLVILVPLSFSLPGRQPPLIVRVSLEGRHLGNGIDPAFKRNLGGSNQLLVFIAQVVFLLQLRDNIRGEGLQFHLRLDKHQVTVFRGKIRPER